LFFSGFPYSSLLNTVFNSDIDVIISGEKMTMKKRRQKYSVGGLNSKYRGPTSRILIASNLCSSENAKILERGAFEDQLRSFISGWVQTASVCIYILYF